MTDIERVDDYLQKAGAFYLTTVDSDKLGVFHLEEATAEFRSMMSIKETIKF